MRIFTLFFNLLFFIGLSAAAVAQVCTTPTRLNGIVVNNETCFGNARIRIYDKRPTVNQLPANSYYEYQLVKSSDSSVVKQWQQSDTFYGNINGDTYKIMSRIVCPTGVSESFYSSNIVVSRTIAPADISKISIINSSSIGCCTGIIRVDATGSGPLQYALVSSLAAPDLPSSLIRPKQSSNIFDSLCGNTTYYVRVWDACGGFATMATTMKESRNLPSMSAVFFRRMSCDSLYINYSLNNILLHTDAAKNQLVRHWVEYPDGSVDTLSINSLPTYLGVNVHESYRFSIPNSKLASNYDNSLPFPSNALGVKEFKFYYRDVCGIDHLLETVTKSYDTLKARLDPVADSNTCRTAAYDVHVYHTTNSRDTIDLLAIGAQYTLDNGATWNTPIIRSSQPKNRFFIQPNRGDTLNIKIALCNDTLSLDPFIVDTLPALKFFLTRNSRTIKNTGCTGGIRTQIYGSGNNNIGDSVDIEIVSGPLGVVLPPPVRVNAKGSETYFYENLPFGEYVLKVTDSVGLGGCSRSTLINVRISQQVLQYTLKINNVYACNDYTGIELYWADGVHTNNRPLTFECITQPVGANVPSVFTIPGYTATTETQYGAFDSIPELRSIPPGTYTFKITDSVGLPAECVRTTTESITIAEQYTIKNKNYVINQLCNNTIDITINEGFYGGNSISKSTFSFSNHLKWQLIDSNNVIKLSGEGKSSGDQTKIVINPEIADAIQNGTYRLRTWLDYRNAGISDSCTIFDTVWVKGRRSIEISSSQFIKGCGDDTTAAVIVGNVLGSSPEFYTWALYKGARIIQDSLYRGPQASNIFNGLSANQTYLLTATDTCGYGQNYVLRQSNDIRVFGTNSTNTQCPGENVTLSTVNLQGAQLQWYKDGTPIPGATTNVLQLNNIQVATDAGVYTVEANIPNQTCEVLSSSFELTIDCQALPIDLARFNGYLLGDKVRLDWSLYNIDDVNRFEIERSNNGTEWNQIGMVFEAEYQGEAVFNYHFLDQKPAKDLNLYRLKMIEKDGRYSYSNVVKINLNATASMISIHPNPATDMVTIEGLSGQDVINVYDVSGRLVEQLKANASSFSMPVRHYVDGVYTIRIQQQNGVVSSHKLIKQ